MSVTPLPAPAELLGPQARSSYARARKVLRALIDQGHEAYLVGGGVRDLLLGRDVSDWDVATSAAPETVLSLRPKVIPTGILHGTVTVMEDGEAVEVTTYRTDGPYADGRHPDWVRFGVSLEEDLARRDYTVNAMALDPERGELVDPHDGRVDLARRILRTVGDPDQRFREDALRPLRGIRLAAVLDFEVEPATLAAMGRAREGVARVAPERVREELVKLLRAEHPSIGFEHLRETGVLSSVLPELLEGVGMEQNRHHMYPVYDHILRAVDSAPRENLRVRLAALFHDLAKPRTLKVVDGQGTFRGHESVGATMAEDVMSRLRFSRDEIRDVSHLVAQHMFHYTPEWSDAAVRRFVQRVGREHLTDLFALRVADNRGNGTKEAHPPDLDELKQRVEHVLARHDAITRDDLAVDGKDLIQCLGLGQGPGVGRLLATLLDRVIEDPSLNDRDELLRLARSIDASS